MSNTELSPLEVIFRDFLNGKTARISSGGLLVHGSMEGECVMEYQRFHGVKLYTRLKWNESKFIPKLKTSMYSNRLDINLSYLNIEDVNKIIDELSETFHVLSGLVSCVGVKSYSVLTGKEGIITGMEIFYHKGSSVQIRNIEKTLIK